MQLKSLKIEYDKSKAKSFDEMYMRLANDFAKLSTCARVQVGAVLVVDNRPLLSGYNGTPKGHRHCIDIFQEKFKEYQNSWEDEKLPDKITDFNTFMNSPAIKEEHGIFSRLHEIHAEINIITQAAYKGLSVKGGTIYVTCSPCNDCSKAILAAGIKEVVFQGLYDRETEGLEILAQSGVRIRQLKMNNGLVEENIRWQV